MRHADAIQNKNAAAIAEQMQAYLARGGKIEVVPTIFRALQQQEAFVIDRAKEVDRREAALKILKAGQSLKNVAHKMGIPEKTLRRWVMESRK